MSESVASNSDQNSPVSALAPRQQKTLRSAASGVLVILIGTILMLMVIHPAALIPTAGLSLDEWQYFGIVDHYLDVPDHFIDHYKTSRLPWVLALVLFYETLPWNIAAVLVAGFSIFLGATFAYLVLRQITDEQTAFGLGVLIAFFPDFAGSGGWGYHNALAGPMFLASLVAVWYAFKWVNKNYWIWAFVAGGLFGFTVHTKIVFINLAIAFLSVGICSLLDCGYKRLIDRKWIITAIAGFSGAVAFTLLLSLVNVLVGRRFDFWTPLFDMAARFLADSGNQASWWKPLSMEWIVQSPYLHFPLAILFGGAVWIAVVSIQGNSPFRLIRTDVQRTILVLQYLFTFVLWVYWQLAGQVALDWIYYAYPVNFSALLCLAAMGGRDQSPEKTGLIRKVGLMAAVIVCISLSAFILNTRTLLGQGIWYIILILTAGLVLAFVFLPKLRIRTAPVIIAGLFVVLTIPSQRITVYPKESEFGDLTYDRTAMLFDLRDAFGEDLTGRWQRVLMWFDVTEGADQPGGDWAFLHSFAQTNFYPQLVPDGTEIEDLPESGGWTAQMRRYSLPLVMVTFDDRNVERMIARLREIGMNYKVQREEIVKGELNEVRMVVLESDPLPEVDGAWKPREYALEKQGEEIAQAKAQAEAAAQAAAEAQARVEELAKAEEERNAKRIAEQVEKKRLRDQKKAEKRAELQGNRESKAADEIKNNEEAAAE